MVITLITSYDLLEPISYTLSLPVFSFIKRARFAW
jgi:hypothetical protein